MAEPLKRSFGPDVPVRIAAMIEAIHPLFPSREFIAHALNGYEELELTPRARHISAALARYLPEDPEDAIEILVASLGPKIEHVEGMAPFIYLPHVYFVAEHGLSCFETAMQAQYELTQRFTAEFSIRAFLDRYPTETLDRLRDWARDPSHHVRRLVSEGTRPRLPWAPRLRRFQQDPEPVLELLEMLKDDSEEYVRRSVANNLNDISKDHPDLVVEVARRWAKHASNERRRLIRHALRTLVKQGHPVALGLLGFEQGSPVSVESILVSPDRVSIGDRVRLAITVHNGTAEVRHVAVDLRIHFVKSNGNTSPKVFKGAELELGPGDRGQVRKSVSVAQHSTRTHHPGRHDVEVVVNGSVGGSSWFTIEEEPIACAPVPDGRQSP